MIFRKWQKLVSYFDSLYELEVACFGNSSWDENTWENLFKNRELFVRLEFQNELLMGFCVISLVADEAELLRIAVRKEFRGKGIGRRLLDLSIQELGSPAVKSLFLEVRADNEGAILFYQQYGFQKSGCRRQYYSEPVCDALLYSFIIKRS